jgi:hypothetical protein
MAGTLSPLGNDVMSHIMNGLTPLELITLGRTDRYMYYVIIVDGWKGEDHYWQHYLISTSLSSHTRSHRHMDDVFGLDGYVPTGSSSSRDLRVGYRGNNSRGIPNNPLLRAPSPPHGLFAPRALSIPPPVVAAAVAPVTNGETKTESKEDNNNTNNDDDESSGSPTSPSSNESDNDIYEKDERHFNNNNDNIIDQTDTKRATAVPLSSPRARRPRTSSHSIASSTSRHLDLHHRYHNLPPHHHASVAGQHGERYWFNNIRRLLYGHLYLREQVDHQWLTYQNRNEIVNGIRRMFSFTQRGIMPFATWMAMIYFLGANSAFASYAPTRVSHIATAWLTILLLIWCVPIVYIAMLLRVHDDWRNHIDTKLNARQSLTYLPFKDRLDPKSRLTTLQKRSVASATHVDQYGVPLEYPYQTSLRPTWPLPYWVWDYGQIWLWPPSSTSVRTRRHIISGAFVFASLIGINIMRLMWLYGYLTSIMPVMYMIAFHMIMVVYARTPEVPFFVRGYYQRRLTIWMIWFAQLLISAWPYDWSPYVMHTSSFALLVAMCVTIAETEYGGTPQRISRGIDRAIMTWIICAMVHHLLVAVFEVRWMMFIAWLPLTAIACVVFFETSRNAVARRPLR